jgi:ATP phosphoribosyltransferase regulatory subunit
VIGAVSPAARAEGARLFQAFQSWGAQPVEVAVLQPAGLLLDVYGEDIRARAYVTRDPVLGEMMLRPDFTVPVVQAHMAAGAEPARYAYLGEVFRKQEGPGAATRAREYLQVGYEVFDRAAPLRADAEVFSLFARLLAGRGLRAAIGDIGLLRAAVAGLPLSPRRQAALMRHLWRPRRFRALLERFSRPVAPRSPVASEAPLVGLRGADEIAERLAWLQEEAAEPPLAAGLVAAVDRLLAVAGPAAEVPGQLAALLPDLPWLAPAAARFAERLELLAAQGADPKALEFEASYGRTTLEYYDGFVFGLYAAGRPDLPPVASGGRYDALTAVLGQGRSIPAVGGVIRPGVLVQLGGGGCG